MARQSQPHYDVIVIGAGAAGMMCAATAGQRGRSVLLLDHYPKLGEKIRISGGGRCNFTNLHASPANYLSRNPHFCRSALARYTPRHFIALVEKHRIAYHEKTLGQLFCDDSATQVIAMLKAECDAGGVEWRMPCEVRAVAREGAGFRVDTAAGPATGASLVVATGGLTVPKIGATPFGYRLAEQFGLAVVPPKPALVPLSLDPLALERYGDLSGVSLEAEVSCRGARFRESLLFTHRGLSGPAVLQASSYWQDGPASDPILVNLLPGVDAQAWIAERRRAKALLATLLAETMPRRFAQAWCQAHALEKPVAELPDKALREAAREL
ncbi:MAG TPA: aminoacetone oxidase family FAD-binding enzyme, partial [Usitatibacteraceae bacterium]|nr:aminoacetone oxidase family FAD-binding enzyme [Usitatibacteraceae bacterium]